MRPLGPPHLTAAVLACCAAAAACSNPGGETRPLEGTLAFLQPSPQETLTLLDDADALTPGLQVQVGVAAVGLPQGSAVTLAVDTTGETLQAFTVGSVANAVVTLPTGPFPGGQASTLRATATGAAPAVVTVHAVGNSGVACRLESPAPGVVLRQAQDQDPATPQLEANLDVLCQGEGVDTQDVVVLEVFARDQVQGAPLLRLTRPRGTAATRFPLVPLPEGTLTLQMSVARASGALGTARAALTVDLGRCDARILAPWADGLLTRANTQDLQPATPALDVDVAVASTLCPTGTVRLRANNSPTGSPVELTRGLAQARAALPQGNVELVATVQPAAGTQQPGDSAVTHVRVDTLVGCPALTTPVAGEVLGILQDQEMPPDPTNGITWTLRGTVQPTEPGTSVTVELRRGNTVIATHVVDAANGDFAVVLANMPAGQYTASVLARDAVGNACPQRGSAPPRVPFVVTTAGPEATLALANDANGDGAINIGEDADILPGAQVNVALAVTGTSHVGGSARVRLTPLDAAGNPTGGTVVEGLEALTAATTTVSMTVPDGSWRLSAVVSFADARPNLTPDTVRVLVDTTPPTLRFLEPVDGAVLTSNLLQVSLLTQSVDLATVFVEADGVLLPDGMMQPGGLVVFPQAVLPNVPGVLRLVASAVDLAGNGASLPILVTLDPLGPQVVLHGVDRNGMERDLVPTAATGAQARTALDISTPAGVMLLDQDQNAANGLQYAFSVEVPLLACASLGPNPVATLRVTGLAMPLTVPLQAAGAVCRGAVGVGGGITLAEGDGSVEAVVVDTAGRSGVTAGHYTVRRQAGFVRVESPADGARVGAAAVPVVAVSNLVALGTTCVLRVDGAAVESQPLAPLMAFSPVTLSTTQGGTTRLEVTCSGSALPDPVQSLPVTVTRDLQAPVPTLLLASGDPVESVFNASAPNDAPAGHPRFHRNLALETPTESGACAHLSTAELAVVSGTLPATSYNPRLTAAGAWTLVPGVGGGRCRALFPRVDLGQDQDPGTLFLVTGVAVDSAGNRGMVSVSTLVDRLAPTITRTLPAGTTITAAQDAHATVAGIQIILLATVTPDGRPMTATLVCTGPQAVCPGTNQDVLAGEVTFGLDPLNPLTLSNGLEDTATLVDLAVTDNAGNVGHLVETLEVVLPRPVLTWRSPAGPAVFCAVGCMGGVVDADGATPGVQAHLEVDVVDCGTAANPGSASLDGHGPPVPVTQDTTLTFDVTLPQGDAQLLTVRCVDSVNRTGVATLSVDVDGVLPGPAPSFSVHNESPAMGTVVLRFVAPGDDGPATSPVAGYDVAVAPQAVDAANFAAARWPGPAFPGHTAGSAELLRLTGLPAGPHVLTLRTLDDAGNQVLTSAPITVRGSQHTVTGATALGEPGDLDGDGFMDLVVVSPTGVWVLRGDVIMALDAVGTLSGGAYVHQRAHAVADLDGDGRDELVLAGPQDGTQAFLWWGRMGGIPSNTPPDVTLSLPGAAGARPHLGHAAASMDLNGDGALDLVVSAPALDDVNLPPQVLVVLGNGTRTALETAPGVLDLDAAVLANNAARFTGPAASGLGESLTVWSPSTPRLVLGAPGLDPMGMGDAGGAFVVSAPANAVLGGLLWDVAAAAPAPLVVTAIAGDSAGQRLGRVVHGGMVGAGTNPRLAVSGALGPALVFLDDSGMLLGPFQYGPNGETVVASARLGDGGVALLGRTGAYFERGTGDAATADLLAPADTAADLDGDGRWELVRLDTQTGTLHVIW